MPPLEAHHCLAFFSDTCRARPPSTSTLLPSATKGKLSGSEGEACGQREAQAGAGGGAGRRRAGTHSPVHVPSWDQRRSARVVARPHGLAIREAWQPGCDCVFAASAGESVNALELGRQRPSCAADPEDRGRAVQGAARPTWMRNSSRQFSRLSKLLAEFTS